MSEIFDDLEKDCKEKENVVEDLQEKVLVPLNKVEKMKNSIDK